MTVVVSLVTRPKPESELVGLVYGCTELPSEGHLPLYQRPIFWAGVIAAVFRGVADHFLVGNNMHRAGMISIWFFIGVLLLVYGVLILGAGIYDWPIPPAHPVVLARLHAGIWWGALLVVLGLVYSLRFRPEGKSGKSMTFGVIVGNRGFFPGHLAQSGRAEMIAALEKAGYQAVALGPEETRYGAVETRAEAAHCADLFKKHRDAIDGVIVTLPNFGDERAIADTLRMAGLNVPVLVQATPDTPGRMTIADRRDSFCGKMSACNNLTQYGIPYSLTTLHTEAPDSGCFRQDLDWFAAVCRVVRGLRRLRIGAIGARPGRLQHRPLQREDSGSQRHLRRDHRPFRNPGPHRAHEATTTPRRSRQTGGHPALCRHRRRARRTRSSRWPSSAP